MGMGPVGLRVAQYAVASRRGGRFSAPRGTNSRAAPHRSHAQITLTVHEGP
jgi:hypothetical protein